MFDNLLMMREAKKPEIAAVIAQVCKLSDKSDTVMVMADDVQYVLDGCALLHRVGWTKRDHIYQQPSSILTIRESQIFYCTNFV